MSIMKRQAEKMRAAAAQAQGGTEAKREGGDAIAIDASSTANPPSHGQAPDASSTPSAQGGTDSAVPRHALDYIEEIMAVMKTSFPLLTLSMETMVDQIQQKFKALPEEDIYRSIGLMMQDAVQVNAT
jgi:transformation/transcription domain-associated protein